MRSPGAALALAVLIMVAVPNGQVNARLYLPFVTNAVVCQEMFTNGDFGREPRDVDWPKKSGRAWWYTFSGLGGRKVGDAFNGGMQLKPDDGEYVFLWTGSFPTLDAKKITRATLSFDWTHRSSEHDSWNDGVSVSADVDDAPYGTSDRYISALARPNDKDLEGIWIRVTTDITRVVGNPLGTTWSISASAHNDALYQTSWEFDNWSAQVCTRP